MDFMQESEAGAIFVISGISLRAGERLVFRTLRWIFRRDQHWALIGPNGSGKSLLASALAGEVPAVGGEIEYRFRLSQGRAPEDAVVHVSFEQQRAVAGDVPAAARWFSGEQDESLPVRQFLSQDSIEERNPYEILNRPAQSVLSFERRRGRVLRLMELARLEDHPLSSLSNGEMRKLLLARALLRRPRLLILDDPFAGLDAHFRVRLRGILERLMRLGGTRVLLIVTRLDELPRGITHIMCADHCRIVAQGPRKAMLEHPIVQALLHPQGSGKGRSKVPPASVSRHRRESEELVRFEGMSIRFSGRTLLENVDWRVIRGESWALLGPNGSGKSTLLSLMIGDNPQAYASPVYVFGRRRGSGESVWEIKKRIGWVSPELHLHFPEVSSCLEAVVSGFYDTYGCFSRPTSRQIRIARSWLAYFGLAGSESETFGCLSAGLQRMVLLGRALVKSPELLVLDEPCHGLDLQHRMLFLQTIENLLRRKHATMIFVTHRSDEIPRGIRHVMRLRDGRAVRSLLKSRGVRG